MYSVFSVVGSGTRALSYLLGFVVIGLALAVTATSLDVGDIAAWAWQVFGVTFLALYTALVFIAVFAWTRVQQAGPTEVGNDVWHEAGMHAANGVATLALTYTLLGISLGIGQLAHEELTPATVQTVIRGLTEQFSLAFLTTIVGLPTAAALRALIEVTRARIANRHTPYSTVIEGELS
jgi:hypothetical protein